MLSSSGVARFPRTTAFAFLVLSTEVFAQSGSITGHAFDSAGQMLPGVTVTAMPASGGVVTRTTTANDGTYRFVGLPYDTYRVDFELQGFDAVRRNAIRVSRESPALVDTTVPVSKICECVLPPDIGRHVERGGQVLDGGGRPLPRARVEIVTPNYREETRTDGEGRFFVRVPLDTTWRLTASDSGFRPLTQQISGSTTGPIVFVLTYVGETGVPQHEPLNQGCRCAGNLFK